MFASVDSALKWAAEVRSKQLYKDSSVNRMCGKPNRPTQNELLKGLSPLETHEQAVNIFGMVKGLMETDPVAECYLMSKYFYDDDITRIMSRVSMSMYDRSRDVTILVKTYLWHSKVTHRMLREALYCRNSQVTEYQKMVYDIMDKIHYRAIDQIERKMIDQGLIESRDKVSNG